MNVQDRGKRPGRTDVLLQLVCPRCRAKLTMQVERYPVSFRCPEGHAFTVNEIVSAQSENARKSLENILKLWEDKLHLLENMGRQARRDGYTPVADQFERDVEALVKKIAVIKAELEAMGS